MSTSVTTTSSSIAAAELPDLMEAGPLVVAEDELPTPVLLAQGRRADLVWTRSEYMRLLRHLHNGNPENHFYHGWWASRDFSSRQLITPKWKACWSKGATMTRKADEAWNTVCGKQRAGRSHHRLPGGQHLHQGYLLGRHRLGRGRRRRIGGQGTRMGVSRL